MKLSPTRSVLLKNFTSLSAVQVANYLFPLITLPYLVRVLGPEGYGLFNFAFAFIAYFITISDYGFNLTAPREISINRDDKEKLTEIFSSVLSIKGGLLIAGFLLLFLVVNLFSKFKDDETIYYLMFLIAVGHAIYPLWFFQGMEKMKYISFTTITIKAITVLLIFLLVKTRNDLFTLVAIHSFSSLALGVSGIGFVFVKFKVRFKLQSFDTLKYHFFEGGYIFLSTAAINLYTSTNTFILGLFAGDAIVGYFSAADKIRAAVQSMFTTLSRTIYPHLSKLFTVSLSKALIIIQKLTKILAIFYFLLCTLLFIFAEQIVILIAGSLYINSVIVLRIIAFLPMITLVSNIAGVLIIINLGYKKVFLLITTFACVISILLSILIVPLYFHIGTSITMLVTEIYVTLAMLMFLKRKKINILYNWSEDRELHK